MELLKWDLELQTIREGYDGIHGWFQPRVAVTPQGTALLTMTENHLAGSDIFSAVQVMRSDDRGRTWSHPTGHVACDNLHGRELSYSGWSPESGRWDEWQVLDYPDKDRFFWAGAGCTQRVDLPNGEILLPVSVMSCRFRRYVACMSRR
jgi:hypothetical protein